MKSLDPRVGAGKGLGISRLSVDLSHSRSGDLGDTAAGMASWEFPGGPVVRIPRSQCQGPGFDPW